MTPVLVIPFQSNLSDRAERTNDVAQRQTIDPFPIEGKPDLDLCGVECIARPEEVAMEKILDGIRVFYLTIAAVWP